MEDEVVLPVAETPKVDAAPESVAAPVEAPAPKPEKTPEERERARMQRGIDRRTRQLAEARAENEQLRRGLTQAPIGAHNRPDDGDSETVSLSRKDADRLIEERALQRAPEIAKRLSADEQTRASAIALRKQLGDEFEELTDELATVFSAPRQLDVLQAENPAELLRYLTDPDHADEADAIAGMTHFQAGRAIAKLESKLAAVKAKPQPSKVPPPLEAVRGSGPVTKAPGDMTDAEYAKWRKSARA